MQRLYALAGHAARLSLMALLALAGNVAAQGPTAPPAAIAFPPLGSLAVPLAWSTDPAGAVPPRVQLPGAPLRASGWAGETAALRPLVRQVARDQPSLAWELGPYPAWPYLMPATPPAFAPVPDPGRLVAPWRPQEPDGDRAVVAADPVLQPARQATLAGVPELKQKPAPFVKMNLPNPFETTAAIRTKPLADADPPAASSELPPKPYLPVLPIATKP